MIVGGRYNLSLALAVVLLEVFKGQLIDTHRNTAYLQRMREQAVQWVGKSTGTYTSLRGNK